MSTTVKRLGAAALSLMFIFAVASQTNAQSWRRHRDRDLPGGQKAAIIGGGAAAGAVIGAIAGGSKGAIIGGLIGAGAGTAGVLIKDASNNDDHWRGRYRDNRYYPQYRGSRYYPEYRTYSYNDRTFYRSGDWRHRDRDRDHDSRYRRWRR
jgi:hypothetical protein